jgi:MSHA biogenesis protein MshE
LQGTTTLEEVARVAATSEGEFSPEDDIPLPDEPIGGGA